MTTLSTSSSPLPSPSPHPSIPATPTTVPFAASSIDPTTALHLLSLPPLLHPISPHLAALHLARLQLLLNISGGSGGSGSLGLGSESGSGSGSGLGSGVGVGGVLEWWCNSCGGLREGLGGAARGRRRRVKGVKGVKGVEQRVESGTDNGTVMTDVDGVVEPNSGLVGVGISTAAAGSSSNSNSKSNSNSNPPGPAASRTTRKPPNCTICGASFKRPKPDPAALALFPAARRARRSNAAYSGAGRGSGLPAEDAKDAKDAEGLKGAKNTEGVKGAEGAKNAEGAKGAKGAKGVEGVKGAKGVKQVVSSGVVETGKSVSRGDGPTTLLVDPGSASSTNGAIPNPTPGAKPAPTAIPPPPTSSSSSESSALSFGIPSSHSTPRPLLLSTPRLAHIPTADPTPPTYPPPPSLTGVKRPASPPTARGGAGAAGRGGIGGSGGAGGAGAGGRGVGAGQAPGKKRKKSGLAKLLAESKARDESTTGGRWGLG